MLEQALALLQCPAFRRYATLARSVTPILERIALDKHGGIDEGDDRHFTLLGIH
jgi:hypothetical protein